MRVMVAVLLCCWGLKRDDEDSGRDAKGMESRGRDGGVMKEGGTRACSRTGVACHYE
jgi:hypothetical protein